MTETGASPDSRRGDSLVTAGPRHQADKALPFSEAFVSPLGTGSCGNTNPHGWGESRGSSVCRSAWRLFFFMEVKQTNRRAGHDLRPLTVVSAPFGHHHDGKSRVGADVPRDSPRRGAGTTEPGGGSERARQARGPPRRAGRPRAEFPLTAISSLLSSRLFAGESMSPRASDLCFRHVFPWRFGASWRMPVVDFPLVEFCPPPGPPSLRPPPGSSCAFFLPLPCPLWSVLGSLLQAASHFTQGGRRPW